MTSSSAPQIGRGVGKTPPEFFRQIYFAPFRSVISPSLHSARVGKTQPPFFPESASRIISHMRGALCAPRFTEIDSMTDRLLGTREVAEILGVCTRQVRRLLLDAAMPKPVYIGRLPRWRESEINAWLAAGCPSADEFAAIQAAKAVR